MTSSNNLTPVNVLTGFLGSGKPTLLHRLLRWPRMARTAVLINEFGEIGLDHLLVQHVDESVVLLQSGCICCSFFNDTATTEIYTVPEVPASVFTARKSALLT